jgi:nucleoside-diphosphate-sugar epimerase
VQTSLTEPDNWSAAIDGCDAIFHTETPLPIIQAKNPADVMQPAKQGTSNVLEAAASRGTNRIVLTSSVSAIFGGITESRVYMGND